MLHAGRILVASAWLWAAPLGAAAQDQPLQIPSPILTLDQEALFNGSRVAERIAAEIERQSAELSQENRRIEAELTAEELDLTEKRASMDPDAFRALADAFDEKVQAIRDEQDAKARELQRLSESERQNFLRRITPILGELVRERGAVVVLDRRTVFLSAESIDITREAIDRINAAFDDDATILDPDPQAPDPDLPAPDPDLPVPPAQPLDETEEGDAPQP